MALPDNGMYRPPGSNTAQQLVSTEERRQTNQAQVPECREHVQLQEVEPVKYEDRCHHKHTLHHVNQTNTRLLLGRIVALRT